MENIVCSSSDGTLTSNIQESQRTKKSMSDGGVLPLSISKKPGKIFSQTLSSTYAGSLQSGKEDIVIIKDGTKMQNTSVSGVERGNISVFQNEKETMAPGTEDHVKKKSSDDDIVIISHKIVPRRISPGAAERLKNEAKKLHQERYKKRVSRVPDLSACNDTTAKAAMCLPVQHKSHHSRNNTGLSSSICQNTVIYNNTTTFSSEDIKIITNSEISKPENKQKILLNTVKAVTIREVVLEDPSILLKNTSQDVRLISGKSSACNSTTTGKNEIPQAATSGKRNKSALSSGHKLTLSRPKSSQKKNEKEGIVPTRTNLNNIKNNRQSGLYFEHSVGSPSKMLAGEIETNKDNSVIKPSENSVSQCVISCSLSHMEKERNAQSELEENISFKQPNISICELSAVLQKKPWLKVSRSEQEFNTNSSSDFIALKPAANMNQEKPRSPTHVLNVTDTFTTLITEKESVTLASDVCNTVLSHKEANTVKGPIAECEPHSSKGCLSLCMRGDSVKCNFSKSIEVPSTSTSDKQTAVLYSDSSLERRKTTQNEASPPPDTKVKLTVDQLHKYIEALFMDVKSNENEPCSHSSDKEIETNLTSTINNASVHSPDVMSESRRVTTSVSVTCKGGESATHDQSVHGLLLCSGFRSEGKEAGISPEVKRKKKSSCTSTNGTVSSSGSSVACIGSTSATHKQSSTVLCHAQEDVMEPVITITESETTHPQSENFKLSQEISKHPSKFSLTKHNSFEILMAGQKTPQKRSPTKKLSKSSPIRYMINNRSPHSGRYRTTSPNKPDVNRTLKFGSCNTETKSGSLPSTEPKNQSSVSEFSFSKEYVSYFEAIIAEVLKDRDMLSLISEEELKIVTNFWKLETQVKKLYIRMLSRKYTWHRVSDIKYEDINVPAAFIELEVLGLVMSDYNSEELEVLLYMLKVPELRSLCRTFRIPSTMQPKPKLIQVLLEYGKSQQIMSGNKRGDSISIIKSRLREVLGHCIKVCAEGREVFRHILLLFSLPHQNDEEDRESSKQLLLLHYVKTRRVEFPTYVVLKTRPIFSSREDLIRFEKATDLLIDLMKALTTKSWDEARVYGQFAREHFRTVLEDSAGNDYAKSLPLFIRRYTSGSVYAYAMTKALEAFKKCKDQLSECVIILEELLCQDIYLPHYRGKWYDQLALVLQVHLKKCDQAAAAVIEAMKDNHLSDVDQQTLSSRGTLLLRRRGINREMKLKLVENIKQPLREPPSVTIKAKSLQINAPGRKQVYIQENADKQEITYSSVEEYAISHYKSEGYIVGIHDEGSAVNSLFGLIFWDVIYEQPVADVFRSSYQREPLDLRSVEFYRNRKEKIDERLQDLCHWDMKCVKDYMEKIFKEHEGKESVVNWQRFQNLQQIVDLINCIGVQVLSKILERLVKNYRVFCSGFPDLLVWNPVTFKYKFVEVKGPGDRLFIAQHMWLNYLTSCNAKAEVCFVETTGARMLKRKIKDVPAGEDV